MGLTGFNRARNEAKLKAMLATKSEKEEAAPVAPTVEPKIEPAVPKTEAVSTKKEHAVGRKKAAANVDTSKE